ncbi:MAG: bifunctional homocysteine S-methyltransferase/methylenetetrahydrofolate reductase [Paenibacillaceae bacterium]|nr:bifunctional homocysteine S-methyltransferase/methylenetetrahydrofolate reductase [Paenibacillaceae bacterium]
MKQPLRQALENGVIVADGALGTYLYQLGFSVGQSFEEFNLIRPEVIQDVHRQYVEAGARLLETNTFAANRGKLAKFGLEAEVEAINRAGVRIAREAAAGRAYVVGSVGSIRSGRHLGIPLEDIERDLREQIAALLAEAPDGILLETFYDAEELLAALRIVRSLSDIPVICQLATDGGGMTQDGQPVAGVFRKLRAEGADVVGFNCHSGPDGIMRALEKVQAEPGPFSVFPNAGLPRYEDGRYTYLATPDYFAGTAVRFAELGARIVGGCCGTTPAHIAAIAGALKGYVPAAEADAPAAPQEPGAPAARAKANAQAKPAPAEAPDAAEPTLVDLVRQRPTVIVELDSPRDLAIDKFMRGAEALREAGADAVTMADNSLAMTRMSNLSMGYLVKDRVGVRPLLHIACRDRNSIGTQSHLMGLHALGINHVLAITGDPARVGDLPGASSVFDLTSLDLIRMTKQLNDGVAFSGKPLKAKANFVVGAAFDPNVRHLDKAVQRMEKKIAAGADYFMTQPIYDPLQFGRMHEATKHLDTPIFVGIMPLLSGRNAEFLHNEVPGIRISEGVRQRMAGLEGEEGRRMGVEIAKELVDAALEHFNGIYFMTPMLFFEMTAELTRYVWRKSGRADSPLYR